MMGLRYILYIKKNKIKQKKCMWAGHTQHSPDCPGSGHPVMVRSRDCQRSKLRERSSEASVYKGVVSSR